MPEKTTHRSQKVYLNGKYLCPENAHISVFDRGLQYGDGLFETLRAYNGKVFLLNEHITRLQAGAKTLSIQLEKTTEFVDIKKIITKLLRSNDLSSTDAIVKIIITRGVDVPYPSPVPNVNTRPTIVITARPLNTAKISKIQRSGVQAVFLKQREVFPDGMKTLNYLPAITGKIEASKKGAFEGIFISHTGKPGGMGKALTRDLVLEGTSSNVFIVKDNNTIKTPPLGRILPGITRDVVIRIARECGLTVKETEITVGELKKSREVFITNSAIEIVPVTKIDDVFIGSNKASGKVTIKSHPATRLLQKAYLSRVKSC